MSDDLWLDVPGQTPLTAEEKLQLRPSLSTRAQLNTVERLNIHAARLWSMRKSNLRRALFLKATRGPASLLAPNPSLHRETTAPRSLRRITSLFAAGSAVITACIHRKFCGEYCMSASWRQAQAAAEATRLGAPRGVEHHRHEARRPIVAMHDVRRPVELLAERDRNAKRRSLSSHAPHGPV